MSKIEVRSTDSIRVEVTNGQSTISIDEPIERGGTALGPTPPQAVLAGLGACTAMTLRLYAGRKEWPLEDVKVVVSVDVPDRKAEDQTKHIRQEVTLFGPLDEEQRARLLDISGRCPVHKLLEGPLAFEEVLAEPEPTGGVR